MSENINIFSIVTDIKSVISLLFVKISPLNGGGGGEQQLAPWRGIFAHNRILSSNFGLNHSAKSDLGADGFFNCLYLGLKKSN